MGLETRLETITGLRVASQFPDAISVPSGGGAAFVGLPPEIEYHRTMGNGRVQFTMTVVTLVAANPSRAAQLLLATYLNPGSGGVRAAVEGDKRLTVSGSPTVEDAFVDRGQTLGEQKIGDLTYLGASFDVRVIALGA